MIQVRKEKRIDRTNIERRKFKIDSAGEATGSQLNLLKNQNLDFFKLKCTQISASNDIQLQLEAVVYFRRILAAGKSPPLDLLFQNEGVVITMIAFLSRFDQPKLQFESAWCITNVACGEPHQLSILVAHNIIPSLSTLIANSGDQTIVQQALWALCNLSNDDNVCRLLANDPNILVLILSKIGVECNVSSLSNTSVQYSPVHLQLKENPSLSSMRHVTFICGNILK